MYTPRSTQTRALWPAALLRPLLRFRPRWGAVRRSVIVIIAAIIAEKAGKLNGFRQWHQCVPPLSLPFLRKQFYDNYELIACLCPPGLSRDCTQTRIAGSDSNVQ